MGHCDTQMIFKHYTRYVKRVTGAFNGENVNAALLKSKAENGNHGE